jgi:hypothetical protein
MIRQRPPFALLVMALGLGLPYNLLAPSVRGAEPAQLVKDGQALAETIDQLLAARWAAAKALPAAPADDAEFLRRLYLDLTGKVPPVGDVRAFLADTTADKRQRVVEQLLKSPACVNHFTNVWRAILLPENNNANIDGQGLRANFESWLRTRLSENVGYDKLVREVLTFSANRGGRNRGELELLQAQLQAGNFNNGTSPIAFYLANENKPEVLAGSTSRLFLAVKLECAQCHDHPFAKWSQEQFWQTAAFFAGVPQGNDQRQIRIPTKGTTVQALFLDGSEPKWKQGVSPRVVLADWTTSPQNRYFARATVNRLWAQFFGIGLIEPVDDLTQETEKNPLLDELANQFAAHRFDLQYLIRGIVNSKAYQLSSVTSHPSQENGKLFARMGVKGMSPEQLFDSLVEATRHQGALSTDPKAVGAFLGLRADFLTRFPNQTEKKTEFQTSILQALALMNGKFIADATSLGHSETLAAVADAPFMDTAGRIETLYLAAYGRKPRPQENARLVKYVDQGGPSHDPQQALADVFWVLLNSSEFFLNH